MSSHTKHQSVLLHEVLMGLEIQPHDIVVDATLGGGGHAYEILKCLGPEGVFVGLDLDQEALDRTELFLGDTAAKKYFIQSNYRYLPVILPNLGIAHPTKMLFDLGISSDQLEVSGRGFSFKGNEPLSMSMSVEKDAVTAQDIVNEWEEHEIECILREYGEERFARRIAHAIVEARGVAPLETTQDLVRIIDEAVPGWYRHGRTHSATKTFQAIRIAANDELESLTEGLTTGFEMLAPGGRIAVITFHSLEDRIVKHFFKEQEDKGRGKNLYKKPKAPTKEEIENNPRARSAKLRIIEKTV